MAKKIAGAIGDDLYSIWSSAHEEFGFTLAQMIRYAIAKDCDFPDADARRIALAAPEKPLPQRKEMAENA